MAATHGKNDTRFDDLTKRITKYGEEGAKGKDSLPKLIVATVQAAQEGIIDLQKDKHGKGKDDAYVLYEHYTKGASKSLYDHTPDSIKSQTSKVRTGIKAGRHPHASDPFGTVTRAVELYADMAKVDPKSIKSPYPALVDVCRAIFSKQSDLDEAEIKGAMMKNAPADKSVIKELNGIMRKMERLISGECGVRYQGKGLVVAFENVRDDLNDLNGTNDTEDEEASEDEEDENDAELVRATDDGELESLAAQAAE